MITCTRLHNVDILLRLPTTYRNGYIHSFIFAWLCIHGLALHYQYITNLIADQYSSKEWPYSTTCIQNNNFSNTVGYNKYVAIHDIVLKFQICQLGRIKYVQLHIVTSNICFIYSYIAHQLHHYCMYNIAIVNLYEIGLQLHKHSFSHDLLIQFHQ